MAELRKRGLWTAMVCSQPFEHLGRTQAGVLGVPDLPIVVIPHPLGGISFEMVKVRAELAIPKLIEMLRGYLK